MIQINHIAKETLLPSSISKKSFRPDSDDTSQLRFRRDEVFEGKVLKLLGSGDALLLVKGKNVIARANVPLSEGVVLTLKVQENLSSPILKLLGIRFTGSNKINIPVILSAMRENIWKSIHENAIRGNRQHAERSQLRELIDDLSNRQFLKPGPDMLKRLIDKSGMSWEAKFLKAFMNKSVAGDNLNRLIGEDLKGLASRLVGLEQEEGVLLSKLLSTIENLQLLNHHGLHQERKLFLPIPMQFPNRPFSLGQILIHLPRKEKDECGRKRSVKNFFRVTFMLDLSDLGPIRADLAIKDERIEGKFLLAEKETKSLIENSLISFIRNLRDMGFTIDFMECHLKEPSVIRQSLVKEIIKEEFNNICLVA